MANMTSVININVDTKIKEEATSILKGLGLNMSTFINMALTQVVKRNGVPFEVVNPTPSKDILVALAEVNELINNSTKIKKCNSMKELKETLLSDN